VLPGGIESFPIYDSESIEYGGTSLLSARNCKLGGLTVEISDKLLCLFNAEVREEDDSYVVQVPKREVETGAVDPGEVYRVALISRVAEATEGEDARSAPSDGPQPPVEIGELRYVEIEDIGKQGDGIARVERGYVIIVPGAEVGEQVKIEVTEVKSNFAVGEIVDDDV
jgi:predicted RNA-binding protein with TRAM domain